MEIGIGDIAFEIKNSRGGAEKTDIKRLNGLSQRRKESQKNREMILIGS
jgi:hypothetical protein